VSDDNDSSGSSDDVGGELTVDVFHQGLEVFVLILLLKGFGLLGELGPSGKEFSIILLGIPLPAAIVLDTPLLHLLHEFGHSSLLLLLGEFLAGCDLSTKSHTLQVCCLTLFGGSRSSGQAEVFILVFGIGTTIGLVPSGAVSLELGDLGSLLGIGQFRVSPDLKDVLGNTLHVGHAILPGSELGGSIILILGIGATVGVVPFGSISLELGNLSILLGLGQLGVGLDLEDVLSDTAHVRHAILPGSELGGIILIMSNNDSSSRSSTSSDDVGSKLSQIVLEVANFVILVVSLTHIGAVGLEPRSVLSLEFLTSSLLSRSRHVFI